MDLASLLSAPFSSIWTILGYIVPFLGVMTFIVFFHEFGHFIVARWCGVKIEAFSIGFGREIFGWNDKHGTRWKIAWLPLGGYVKFEGDENAASVPSKEVRESASETSFYGKPLWQRALIVVAGPMANFLLAIAIFSATFMIVGVSVSDPVVDTVIADSAAAEAGLKPGDRFVSINGQPVKSFMDVRRIVSARAGEKLTTVIDRAGRKLTVILTPRIKEVPDGLGGKTRVGMIGVTHNVSKDAHFERKNPAEALKMGVEQTWQIVAGTMSYLKKLVAGEAKSDQVAGPIRIAQYTSVAASVSFAVLVQLAGILSVSIGLVNLFPVPMLDGGHLLYYLIEAVRGKPLGQSAQELGFKVGLALVLALMLATTFNDILHLFSS